MKLDIFKRNDGQWGWRMISPNGQTIATSGEGFTRRRSAKRAGRRVLRLARKDAADV